LEADGSMADRDWREIAQHQREVTAVFPLRPVAAIVATQDCDAARGRDITLCEIQAFRDVERKAKDTKKTKSWVNILTQHARINQKWFYLPPDARMGFTDKMAVDFMVTSSIAINESPYDMLDDGDPDQADISTRDYGRMKRELFQ
jgi:hypothetical protein